MKFCSATHSQAQKYQVVFLRHGESLWNSENKFTGWTDIKLSPNGIRQAIKAGQILHQNNFCFDVCYTSVLARAIQTFNYVADQMNLHYIPVIKSWRLNERHLGILQGLNKIQTVQKYGKEQVQFWRRSYDGIPPPLEPSHETSPINDPRYKDINSKLLPFSESLKDTLERGWPLWDEQIAPAIKEGKRVLVVGHGNTFRGLMMKISNISEKDITQVNIPTSIPLIYSLDENLMGTKMEYLEAIQKVRKQTQK